MKVKISKTYSPSIGVTLEPGEHELDADQVERAKRFGVIDETPAENKPPKNRSKAAPRTK